jgi:hypothetical protein
MTMGTTQTHRLGGDTNATRLHGITGQEVYDTIIPAETAYTVEGRGTPTWEGDETTVIIVEGERFRVRADDIH